MGELVAGETHDDKALVFVLLVKGFEALVLRGKTAFAGGVDNHQHLALELGKVQFLTIVAKRLEIINRCHIPFLPLKLLLHPEHIVRFYCLLIYIVHDTKVLTIFETAKHFCKNLSRTMFFFYNTT